jgi:hypothetical protein
MLRKAATDPDKQCVYTRYRGFDHKVRCKTKKGTTEAADGLHYCPKHHPVNVAAKRAEKTAAFEAGLRADARQRQLDALRVALADAICSHITEHGSAGLPERVREIAEAIIAT